MICLVGDSLRSLNNIKDSYKGTLYAVYAVPRADTGVRPTLP